MAKQLTIYVESREESDGFPYSRVRTYKEHLADIYFLDSGTCKGYLYCIEYPNGFWDNKEFETEKAAVNHVAQHYGLDKKYDQTPLNLLGYWNSEWGAIRRTA